MLSSTILLFLMLKLINVMFSNCKMSKTIAVGDIHGNLNQLMHPLLEYLNNPNVYKRLIFVGDYSDRGVSSFKVYYIIKNIMESSNWDELKDKIIFIAGNHDVNNVDGANKISKKIKELKGLRLCYYDDDLNVMFCHSSQKLIYEGINNVGNNLGIYLNPDDANTYLDFNNPDSLKLFKCFTWTTGNNSHIKSEVGEDFLNSLKLDHGKIPDYICIHGHDHDATNINNLIINKSSHIKNNDISIDHDAYKIKKSMFSDDYYQEYSYVVIEEEGKIELKRSSFTNSNLQYDTKSLMDIGEELKGKGIDFSINFCNEEDIFKTYVEGVYDNPTMTKLDLKMILVNDIKNIINTGLLYSVGRINLYDVFFNLTMSKPCYYIEPVEIYQSCGLFTDIHNYNPLSILNRIIKNQDYINGCNIIHPTNDERFIGGIKNNKFILLIIQFVLFSLITVCIACVIIQYIKNNRKHEPSI